VLDDLLEIQFVLSIRAFLPRGLDISMQPILISSQVITELLQRNRHERIKFRIREQVLIELFRNVTMNVCRIFWLLATFLIKVFSQSPYHAEAGTPTRNVRNEGFDPGSEKCQGQP